MYLFAILLFSRSTSGTAVNASGLSGLPANSDTKIATSPPGSGNSPGVVALGTKYDPYTGASFRENPDYSDLVIGRATGCSSSTSHVPGTLMEANRTGSYQLYGLHERRPLRGKSFSLIYAPTGVLVGFLLWSYAFCGMFVSFGFSVFL